MERVVVSLLAVALLLRYPIHFLLDPPFLMDFDVYWTVAHRVLAGETSALYAPTTAGSDMMMFRYAPCWALLWAPLAWLPKSAAMLVWTTGSVLALVVTLLLSARICRWAGLRPYPFVPVIALFIILRPLGEETGNGQVNVLWGALTTGAIWAVQRARVWMASGLLAAAMLLKLPAAVFVPYLAWRRSRRPAIMAVALAAGLAILSSALLLPGDPLRLVLAWSRSVAASGAYAVTIGNQSFLALLGRFLTADAHGLNVMALPPSVLPWIALAALVVSVCVVAVPARLEPRARFVYDTAMLSVLMVLFSPSAWLATYTVLLFPAYVAAAGLGHPTARHDRLAWMLAAIVAILAMLMHRKVWQLLGIVSWRGETYLFLVFMILPWLGVALAALLWRLRRLQARLPA